MVSRGPSSSEPLSAAQRRNVRAQQLGYKNYYERRIREGQARGLTRRQAAGREPIPIAQRFRRQREDVTAPRPVTRRRYDDFDSVIDAMDRDYESIVQVFVSTADPTRGSRRGDATFDIEYDGQDTVRYIVKAADLTDDNIDRFVDVRSDHQIYVVYATSVEILMFEGPSSARATADLTPEQRATSRRYGNVLNQEARQRARAEAQRKRDARNARRRANRAKGKKK